MAKIIFPSAGSPPIGDRGNISVMRRLLTEWASYLEKSPGSKTDVGAQISAFLNYVGITPTLPATQAIVANGQSTVPLGDATAVAAGQDTGTAAVAAGAITRITLPGTDKIIKSTVKYTGPAITGSYVNGYTFTIVNGAITAIVAS